jgi:hypothetical protein
VTKIYEKGVKLTKKAMTNYEKAAWFKNALFRVTVQTAHRHSRMLLAGMT